MPGLTLTPEERRRHEAMSPVQAGWLDFVAAHPEALEASAFAEFGNAAGVDPEILQPWPLFATQDSLAPMSEAGRESLRLLKTVPERVFGTDPERMIEFYGMDERIVRRAATLLADPDCLRYAVGRGDFVLGPHGFACCEFNIAGNLGGWQVAFWKERFRSHPLIAGFLAEQRLRMLPDSPMHLLFDHAVEVGLARGLAAGGELNLAVVTRKQVLPEVQDLTRQYYREVLARRAGGLAGTTIVCDEPRLTWKGGRAWHDGTPVHLFIDTAMDLLDGPVFRAQTAGSGFAFNGLVSPLLGDKRNLALLSEQAEDGDLYDAEERAAIARFIPWTRLLADGFTGRHGERIYLPDFARAERERLLIKPGSGFGGKNVFAGSGLAPAEWEARLDAAIAEGGWVIQDFVPSETFLFQALEGGAVPHELIWGAFVFGDRFGSCLVRGGPGGAGIVNVSRGARSIVLLEVEDDAVEPSSEPFRHEESFDVL
jgi:hypothetical protein